MEKPEYYLEKAREAEQEGVQATDPALKESWRLIALNFRELAVIASKAGRANDN